MKNKKPVILVTNDDGITAPGIRALVEAVKSFGTILIVSPDRPQSGMGHAITVNDVLRLYPSREYGKLESYACSGTPVDCVKLGIYEILGKNPDLIVSGINHGPNYSTNVLYSGTMSAAVEGALEGIPSIGFSFLNYSQMADMSACKKVVKKIVKSVLDNGMPEGICYNVNIPDKPFDKLKGVKVCRQAHAFWEDKFDKRNDPLGKSYYWLTGDFVNYEERNSNETDLWAVENNYVSLVPTQYDMTAHSVLNTIKSIKF